MQWVQRMVLAALIAVAAAGFLVAEGIFADEYALFLFFAIGGVMMLVRLEHVLQRKPKKPAP